MIKLRIPPNGPLAAFLEMEVLGRADYLSSIEPDDDCDYVLVAGIIRSGWNPMAGTLHFDESHADVILDIVRDGINSLDEESESVMADSELRSINKDLINAAQRMVASIRKQQKEM